MWVWTRGAVDQLCHVIAWVMPDTVCYRRAPHQSLMIGYQPSLSNQQLNPVDTYPAIPPCQALPFIQLLNGCIAKKGIPSNYPRP